MYSYSVTALQHQSKQARHHHDAVLPAVRSDCLVNVLTPSGQGRRTAFRDFGCRASRRLLRHRREELPPPGGYLHGPHRRLRNHTRPCGPNYVARAGEEGQPAGFVLLLFALWVHWCSHCIPQVSLVRSKGYRALWPVLKPFNVGDKTILPGAFAVVELY